MWFTQISRSNSFPTSMWRVRISLGQAKPSSARPACRASWVSRVGSLRITCFFDEASSASKPLMRMHWKCWAASPTTAPWWERVFARVRWIWKGVPVSNYLFLYLFYGPKKGHYPAILQHCADIWWYLINPSLLLTFLFFLCVHLWPGCAGTVGAKSGPGWNLESQLVTWQWRGSQNLWFCRGWYIRPVQIYMCAIVWHICYIVLMHCW